MPRIITVAHTCCVPAIICPYLEVAEHQPLSSVLVGYTPRVHLSKVGECGRHWRHARESVIRVISARPSKLWCTMPRFVPI